MRLLHTVIEAPGLALLYAGRATDPWMCPTQRKRSLHEARSDADAGTEIVPASKREIGCSQFCIDARHRGVGEESALYRGTDPH